MKSYYKEWKNEVIEYLGGKCINCDSIDRLEIDHIDPKTKSFDISSNWTVTDKKLLQEEIDKCQILCHECHKNKTSESNRKRLLNTFKHGTMYAWMKRKCPCSICTEAKKAFSIIKNKKRITQKI